MCLRYENKLTPWPRYLRYNHATIYENHGGIYDSHGQRLRLQTLPRQMYAAHGEPTRATVGGTRKNMTSWVRSLWYK